MPESNHHAHAIKKGRERLGLSQRELARKLGVARGTISNWESGRSSPSRESLETLEQAIGPMVLNGPPDTTKDDGAEGIGKLKDFDPYKETEIPRKPGIYVFYDISERPVYVGESKQIATRIGQHSEKFWFKPPIVQSASYIEVQDEELRRQLEQALIKFLKRNAVINKAGKG